MQKKYFTALLSIAALSLVLITFGCDSQGPAEKAGEKVDKTIEATKDAVEKTGEKIDTAAKDAVEKTSEKMDEAAKPKN